MKSNHRQQEMLGKCWWMCITTLENGIEKMHTMCQETEASALTGL